MEKVQQLMREANHDFMEAGLKGSVGAAGTITAATINTWIGITAGLMTCVYMAFQIEAAWRKRKAAIEKHKEIKNELPS